MVEELSRPRHAHRLAKDSGVLQRKKEKCMQSQDNQRKQSHVSTVFGREDDPKPFSSPSGMGPTSEKAKEKEEISERKREPNVSLQCGNYVY